MYTTHDLHDAVELIRQCRSRLDMAWPDNALAWPKLVNAELYLAAQIKGMKEE